jgi:hypothetical protein
MGFNMSNSVLRIPIKTVTRAEYIDDYNDSIFSRVVYPINASTVYVAYVDGSEVLNISGVGDLLNTGGSSINTSEFIRQTVDFSNTTYPDA